MVLPRLTEFSPLAMPGLIFPTAVESAMRRAATDVHGRDDPHYHEDHVGASGCYTTHAPCKCTVSPRSGSHADLSLLRAVLPSQYEFDPSTWTPSSHSFGALGDFEAAGNEQAWAQQQARGPVAVPDWSHLTHSPFNPSQTAGSAGRQSTSSQGSNGRLHLPIVVPRLGAGQSAMPLGAQGFASSQDSSPPGGLQGYRSAGHSSSAGSEQGLDRLHQLQEPEQAMNPSGGMQYPYGTGSVLSQQLQPGVGSAMGQSRAVEITAGGLMAGIHGNVPTGIGVLPGGLPGIDPNGLQGGGMRQDGQAPDMMGGYLGSYHWPGMGQ